MIYDSVMTMEDHVNLVSRSCYDQIRLIGRSRHLLDANATTQFVNGLITSRLDCCNLLLCGVTKATTNKLRRIQNTAARLIVRTWRTEHITPVLKGILTDINFLLKQSLFSF